MKENTKWKLLSLILGITGCVGWGLYFDCPSRCLKEEHPGHITDPSGHVRAELLNSNTQNAIVESAYPAERSPVIPMSSVPPAVEPHRNVASGQDPESALEWRVGMQLEEVQKVVALTSEEQQRLRDALRSQQRERYSSAARFDDGVSKAIGADRMEQIRSSLAAQEAAEQDQRVQEETIVLSRRLQLSGEQEELLGQAIRQVELGLSQKRSSVAAVAEGVMSKHMSGSPSEAKSADLRAGYAQITELNDAIKQERQAALAESLRGILSPSQYDQWINTSVNVQH